MFRTTALHMPGVVIREQHVWGVSQSSTLLQCARVCYSSEANLASNNKDGLWATRVVVQELGSVIDLVLVHEPGALSAVMRLHLQQSLVLSRDMPTQPWGTPRAVCRGLCAMVDAETLATEYQSQDRET